MNEVEINENYNIKRFISKEHSIEYGFYRVLFGIRFRAGWEGLGYVEYDWCCGMNEKNLALALTVFERALESHGKNVFTLFPVASKVKPFDKDEEFIQKLTSFLR
jgi:hypothetical protein